MNIKLSDILLVFLESKNILESALKQVNEFHFGRKHFIYIDNIAGLFDWETSKEGVNYWAELSREFNQVKIRYNESLKKLI